MNLRESFDWRVGDWVEVHSANEILATLDRQGCLDALPFMPEMLPFCGRRFQIYKAAHKTCDPTGVTDLRRMANAVHLETRCDGSAHGGCQAGCLFFWKTAWLKRISIDEAYDELNASSPAIPRPACSLATLHHATQIMEERSANTRYFCQMTEINQATTPLSPNEPRHYLQDLISRNVSAGQLARYTTLAVLKSVKVALRNAINGVKERRIRRHGDMAALPARQTHAGELLHLQAGDKVRVRSRKEIMATLNSEWKNRGLSFDSDMIQYCGGTFPVLRRIERIIDEKTGKMLTISRDCIALESVICTGLNCRNRLFCPRGVYTYWREAWLQRADREGKD